MSVERVEVPMDPAVFVAWQAPELSDEGVTSRELKRIWRCGDRTVRRRLDAANSVGALKTGWRVITDLAGRANRVPVYSFVKPAKQRKVRAK